MAEPFDDFDDDDPVPDAEDDAEPEEDPDPPEDPDDADTGLVVEIATDKDVTTWSDLTEMVDLYGTARGNITQGLQVGGIAHRGEIGTGSGLNFSDDEAAYTLPVKRAFRVRDTVTSPNTILLRGRVAERSSGRGYLPMGDARRFGVGLVDSNAELRGIPIRKWTRPAETDYARMVALWETFLNGDPRPSTDLKITSVGAFGAYSTLMRNANNVTMPAKVYENTDPYGVAADCAEASGKELFITENHEIFYDHPESTHYMADLSITDDNPDGVDSFAPEWVDGEPGLAGGDEFLSGVVVTWSGGREAGVRPDVEDDHDYWREAVGVDAKSAADARRRVTSILDEHAREEMTYSVGLTLYSENVGRIKKGQLISFRAAAAALLEPVNLRIGRLLWEPLAPQLYRAHLELAFPRKLGTRLPGGPRPPDQALVEDGAAVSLTRYQLVHEEGSGPFGPAAGLWETAAPDFTMGSLASPTNAIVDRSPQANISWPYTDCGVGTGGVAGLTTREAWYRFTADLSDDTLVGIRFTIGAFKSSGSGYQTSPGGFLVGDDTVRCGIHTGADADAAEVSDQGDFIEVGRVGSAGGEVFVPRSLLIDAGDGYCWFVLAPGWEISSDLFVCNAAGNKPWGYGDAGTNTTTTVSAQTATLTGGGTTPWVPLVGDVDGTNDTFELPGWNGKGTPEVRVGAVVLGAGEYTWDTSALTVTLTTPPAEEMAGQVAGRYTVGS